MGLHPQILAKELVRSVDEFVYYTFDKCLIFGIKSQEFFFFFLILCELTVPDVDDLLLIRLRQEVEVHVS